MMIRTNKHKKINLSFIIYTILFSVALSGCGLYNKYEQNTPTPSDAFGTDESIKVGNGETSIAEMSWREFFTDPELQQLIEQVLANNTDLNSARIAVEKSEAALHAAKMAYLPSLYFSPQGTLAKFDDNPWSSESPRRSSYPLRGCRSSSRARSSRTPQDVSWCWSSRL